MPENAVVKQHELSCDVLVAGGGPAGFACAIAAARAGARVILCQDRSVLGGNASSEVRMHIVGADCSGGRSGDPETEAREGGIVEEIRLENAVRNPQRSSSMMDLILYEKCRAEPGLTLMLNTSVVGVERNGRVITHAVADRPSTEDRFLISANVFVDCTGDGRLGAEAMAGFRMGREGRNEYDETLAEVEQADGKMLGSTLLFMATRHDRPMPFVAPLWARKFTEADLALRDHSTFEYGYWWCEWGGEIDTIKDNETIRDELLAILLGVWDHIKNGGDHGAEHWALDWFGFLPGKRESRRFVGQYVLNEHDVMNSRQFEDAIAYGGWPIDTHPPEGVDVRHKDACRQVFVPHLYDIPLRSCISCDLDNLMFAGRNISATHIAFASTRVMATCAVIGQGVGVAAAYAVQQRLWPSQLAADKHAIHAIQQRLLRDDAFIIGIRNEDPHDLARRARISASSHQTAGEPNNVLSGQTRSVHGQYGVPADRAVPGTHRWMSDPSAGLPAWLALSWPEPTEVATVELIFDTGLHHILTLSQQTVYAKRMRWGEVQPETATAYRVEGRYGNDWFPLIDVTGNYQRRRVHCLDTPATVNAIRIWITQTGGADHARIAEIRVYGPSGSLPFIADGLK